MTTTTTHSGQFMIAQVLWHLCQMSQLVTAQIGKNTFDTFYLPPQVVQQLAVQI